MGEVINVRKIKYLNKKGNTLPRTEKQIESSRKSMTLISLTKSNTPEARKKRSETNKGRITCPETLFKPGNQFGKGNIGKVHSEEQKKLQSIKMLGKPCPEHVKELNRKRCIEKNPMKNPEICKKQHSNLKGKRSDVTLRNLTNHPLKNPESLKKYTQKVTGKPCPEHVKELKRKQMRERNPMKNPEIAFKVHNNLNVQKNWFKKKIKEKEVYNENNLLINNPIA